MKRYYLTSFISNFYWVGVCLLPAFTISAQSLMGLREKSVMIKGLIKPLKPLSDSIKTYQTFIDVAVPIKGLAEANVRRICKLDGYLETGTAADMQLYVSLLQPSITPASLTEAVVQTTKDSIRQLTPEEKLKNRIEKNDTITTTVKIKVPVSSTFYRMSETITSNVKIELKTTSGMLLFSNKQSLSWTYQTGDNNSKESAQKAFHARFSTPTYQENILKLYQDIVTQNIKQIKNAYDYQTEKVIFIHPKATLKSPQDKQLFAKNAIALNDVLAALNLGYSKEVVYERIKPSLAFFDQQLAKLSLQKKQEKQLYYCAIYNLISAYRSLENYDTALIYARLLIFADMNMNDYFTTQLTTSIVERKERNFQHDYYRQTKEEYSVVQDRQLSQRVDSLAQLKTIMAKITFTGDSMPREVIITDLLSNLKAFQESKGTFMDHTLLDESSYFYKNAAAISTIQTEKIDLAIIQDGSIFLAEKIYQTSKIALYQTLPNLTKRKTLSFIELKPVYYQAIMFVRTGHSKKFMEITSKNALAKALEDCPTVSKLAKHGYYSAYEAVKEYNRICGDDSKSLTERPKRRAGKTIRLELSTGYNAFSSVLGLNTQIRLWDKLSLRAGIGTGAWGVKSAIGFKYDLFNPKYRTGGWSWSLGYTHSSGKPNDTDSINKLPVSTIYFSTSFSDFSTKRKGWFWEFGYGLPLRKKAWSLVDPTIARINIDFEDDIAGLQPGGFILGLGYAWGLF